MKQQSFEKFYYTKVAMGEGCGCAERIIDNHEFDRLSGRTLVPHRKPRAGLLTMVKALVAKARAYRST